MMMRLKRVWELNEIVTWQRLYRPWFQGKGELCTHFLIGDDGDQSPRPHLDAAGHSTTAFTSTDGPAAGSAGQPTPRAAETLPTGVIANTDERVTLSSFLTQIDFVWSFEYVPELHFSTRRLHRKLCDTVYLLLVMQLLTQCSLRLGCLGKSTIVASKKRQRVIISIKLTSHYAWYRIGLIHFNVTVSAILSFFLFLLVFVCILYTILLNNKRTV